MNAIYKFVMAMLAKRGGKTGLTTIQKGSGLNVELSIAQIHKTLTNMGVDVSKITSPKEVEKFLNIHGSWLKKQGQGSTIGKKSADVLDLTGKKIDTSKPILGGKNVELTHNEKIDWLVKNVSPTAEQTIPPRPALEAMLKDGREDLIDHFFEMHTKNLGKPKINIDTSDLKHPGLVKKMMTDEKLKPTLVKTEAQIKAKIDAMNKKNIKKMKDRKEFSYKENLLKEIDNKIIKEMDMTEKELYAMSDDALDSLRRDADPIRMDEYFSIEPKAYGGLAGMLGETDRVPYSHGTDTRPYKSLEDIPPDVLAQLKKDPNFDLETFLNDVIWSDPKETRIQAELRGEGDDVPWGALDTEGKMHLFYQKFGKSEPMAGGLLGSKHIKDKDKVQTILHEMRHKKMQEPWFMKSSAVPKWVQEYEKQGPAGGAISSYRPNYLDADLGPAYEHQTDVTGEELYNRYLDQYFGDVAEKGTIAGSDYKPYFDKILKEHWEPHAKAYKDILKEEKRVKDKPYGLAYGGLAGMLGERTGFYEGSVADWRKQNLTREEILAGVEPDASLLDYVKPRASGRRTIGPPEQDVQGGVIEDVRETDYGVSGMYQGNNWFAGADVSTGNTNVTVTKDGKEIFDDSMPKPDAVNFIAGIGDREGDNAQIKFDKDQNNIQIDVKKTFDFNKWLMGKAEGGLAPLLGEPTYADGGRIGLKDGFDPKRRTILKGIATLAALPIIGKYFKWAKPLAKASKSLTSVPIKAGADGMPLWFKPLVNKVIKEGDDVSKRFATQDRQIVHQSTLPNSKTDVIVTQDLTSGNVSVDIGSGKHGFKEGHLGQPVRLEYKAKEWIEPSRIRGKQTKGTQTKEEFWVEEAEFTGGHPENVKFEDVSYEKFGAHGSDFTEVEKFATGKVKKKTAKESIKAERSHWVPEGEDMASGGRVPLASGSGTILDYDTDWDDMDPDEWLHILKLARAGEFGAAQGGRVPLGGGKKVVLEGLEALFKKFFPGTTKLGKTSRPMAEKTQLRKAIADFQERQKAAKLRVWEDETKVRAAVDDIFPTGDYKMDAEMAAEALVENNPAAFGGKLIDDIDDATRSEIYGEVLKVVQSDLAKTLQLKRLSKPTKTLEGIKKTGTINISDPNVADEFSRFMKESDPKGFKDIEQKVDLSNLDIKGKKGHAEGGRVPMWLGGGLSKGKGLLREMIKYFSKGSSIGKKPSEYLKISNPKQYQKMLNDLSMYKKYSPEEGIMAPQMIKDMIKKTEGERAGVIEHIIGAARNIKKADKSVAVYKKQMVDAMVEKGADKKTAEFISDGMSKAIDIKDTPKITEQGLLEMEQMLKNLKTKGRKLNATGGRVSLSAGGLAGMLGE